VTLLLIVALALAIRLMTLPPREAEPTPRQ
jgi:hypothetical protein